MNTTFPTVHWKKGDTEKAQLIWSQYLAAHDVAQVVQPVAGIDPDTGAIWFGESAQDIWHQQEAQGHPKPLFYIRVGKDYYVSKGWSVH